MEPITRDEMLLDGQDLTPITRKEMFLKRLYDKTQEVPEPITREEWFLNKAAGGGGDITVESLSVTENGTYTAPQGKAYTPVTVEVAPPEDSYQLKSITTPTSLATFNASAMPMPSLKVSVDAKQDLHGYDHPWVGGAGKNKMPNPTAETKTVDNLTVSIDSLGIITVSGSTSTSTTILFDLPSNFVIPLSVSSGGSGCIYLFNPSVNNNIVLMLYNNDTAVDTWTCSELNRRSSSYTAMGGMTINRIGIRVLGTTTISGSFKLSPMITNDGTTDATFEPYSNICPISGWDAANVSDTDDVDNPTVTQTTTIALGQTVYGGELDVVNGTSGNKLKYGFRQGFTRGTLDSSGKLYKLSPILDDVAMWTDTSRASTKISSNMFEVMSLRDARTAATPSLSQHETSFYVGGYVGDEATLDALLSDLQVKYELATPTTFTTSPTSIKSLNGQNNLSVDCGEIIEGEYFIALGGE